MHSERYIDGSYLDHNPTWHSERGPWKAQFVKKLLKKIPSDIKTITEVGCGSGRTLMALESENTNLTYTGYDISENAIKIANDRSSRVMFKHEDYLISSSNTDVILLLDVFEHVEDHFSFLRNINERAQYFIFHIPLDLHASNLLTGKFIKIRAQLGHLHYFSEETALRTLEETGYEILSYHFTKTFQGPGRSLWIRMLGLVRLAAYCINKKLAARLLGGFSLAVLAKPSLK
jgi:SAM-dependent methyltransferase